MSFGVLLNNRLISKLREHDLIIDPWDPENLQIAQYALNPSAIIYEDDNGHEVSHSLKTNGAFIFRPDQYAKVVIEQKIVLPEGIVGRFIPASGLIEAGFGLTAGKLDPGYGKTAERIQFGLKNLRNRENEFSSKKQFTSRVAYIEFFDLRNLPVDSAELRAYDEAIWKKRRERAEFAENGIPEEY